MTANEVLMLDKQLFSVLSLYMGFFSPQVFSICDWMNLQMQDIEDQL